MNIGLREANQEFAKAIRAVRRGEDVVLTDRGRPLAIIKRIDDPDDDRAKLDALAAHGLVQPATIAGPLPLPAWRPITLTGESMTETIAADRGETA
jgi:prevent-host-death family protein